MDKLLKEVKGSLEIIENGGVIIYPTDTIWGIGCDATDPIPVKRIYNIKKRSESKSLIILVSGIDMLERYVDHLPKSALNFLQNADRPTTVIYNSPKGLADNVIATDDTVAIRIVYRGFAHELIKEMNKPLVSTSANFSEAPSPSCFDEIDSDLLKKADYVVNLSRSSNPSVASQIIRFNGQGEVETLRK